MIGRKENFPPLNSLFSISHLPSTVKGFFSCNEKSFVEGSVHRSSFVEDFTVCRTGCILARKKDPSERFAPSSPYRNHGFLVCPFRYSKQSLRFGMATHTTLRVASSFKAGSLLISGRQRSSVRPSSFRTISRCKHCVACRS